MDRYGYKAHSDSYLMSLKKKDIIAELRVAEHNFFVTDEAFDNAVEAGKEYANKYLKLKEQCDELEKALNCIYNFCKNGSAV